MEKFNDLTLIKLSKFQTVVGKEVTFLNKSTQMEFVIKKQLE